MPPAAPAQNRRRVAFALAGTLALAGLAAAALAGARAAAAERSRLLALARDEGVERRAWRDLATRLAQESSVAEMRLETSRVLLVGEILRPPPWRTDETRARLGRVLELAQSVAREQPASHQALALYASALTLLRTRTADTRLFTRSEQWERPLALAVELAPTYEYPKEALAFAYLEVWPAIAREKRPAVEAILRDAFADEATFRRLAPKWLSIAGSLDAAAALLPDEPWAWTPLADRAAREKDWPGFVRVRGRLASALRRDLETRLAGVDERVAAGDLAGARRLADEALAKLPVDRASADALERLLARRPAGPASIEAAKAAESWLDWQEPLALIGRSPLSAAASTRLVSLAAGDLAPDKAAFAILAGGDLARAEVYERRSESLWSERWAPYLTLKARVAHERGDNAASRAALAAAHRGFRSRLAWSLLASEVGVQTATGSGGPAGAERSETATWDETAWVWSNRRARLEILPAREARSLRFVLSAALPAGGVVEPILDGESLGLRVLAPGSREVVVGVSLAAEPHVLELRPLVPGVRPTAAVELF